jgi:hypothetical protein
MRRPSTSRALRLLRAFRLALLVSTAATGCGTSATITDRSGARQEAVIIRGNATHLVFATTEGRIALRRDEIAAIDHPGNVMAEVGAALLIPSLAWLISPAVRCEEGRQHTFCMGWLGAATFAAVGLTLAIRGAAVWHRSHEAATQVSPPSLNLVPLVWDRDARQSPRFGAALSLSY